MTGQNPFRGYLTVEALLEQYERSREELRGVLLMYVQGHPRTYFAARKALYTPPKMDSLGEPMDEWEYDQIALKIANIRGALNFVISETEDAVQPVQVMHGGAPGMGKRA